ncbi:MAG: 16S rRNA (cytosine(1402)-N(4))-methyltransferase RsmH [Ruminococcaceae bacterium]|nr:16S rRNA (cytosine(1402)-N(4))-methyltransferase RsmH [Oscillospiraceae bacterium]
MGETFKHISVMPNECIDGLNIDPAGIYVDCTAGGGGHSYLIAERLLEGRLIAIDQDINAIEAAKKKLAPFIDKVEFFNGNFSNIEAVLEGRKINGALIDLGVSSYQIDTPERGFSYNYDAPLDMRMDETASLNAYEVVNNYPKDALERIFFEYGEEKFSKKVAALICESRETAPIKTTLELVEIIKRAIPAKFREKGSHPAKRVFQAIRIEVNNELGVIEPTLKALVKALKPGGRLCVISFHSLEDRIVKRVFAELSKGCTCPADFPVCVCGKKAEINMPSRKPILPTAEELSFNSRSHSAKLRIAEKN